MSLNTCLLLHGACTSLDLQSGIPDSSTLMLKLNHTGLCSWSYEVFFQGMMFVGLRTDACDTAALKETCSYPKRFPDVLVPRCSQVLKAGLP